MIFFSITHYDSNAMQKNINSATIISKYPALMSNEIIINRSKLTKIDIYQVQRLYQCTTLRAPRIVRIREEHRSRIEKADKRFMIETEIHDIDPKLALKYLNKSHKLCGLEHYWPLNYPIIDQNHRHYKYSCIPKVENKKACRFSMQCLDERAFCIRLFF